VIRKAGGSVAASVENVSGRASIPPVRVDILGDAAGRTDVSKSIDMINHRTCLSDLAARPDNSAFAGLCPYLVQKLFFNFIKDF
jgi:hypothetical protein